MQMCIYLQMHLCNFKLYFILPLILIVFYYTAVYILVTMILILAPFIVKCNTDFKYANCDLSMYIVFIYAICI